MMREKIKALVQKEIREYYQWSDFAVTISENSEHGDYASNVAFAMARALATEMEKGVSALPEVPGIEREKFTTGDPRLVWNRFGGSTPLHCARYVGARLGEKIQKGEIDFLKSVEVAGPGFLNFWLKDSVLLESLRNIVKNPETFGQSSIGAGKIVMVEYFQLNIAKRPHIGHVLSALIGDSLKRLFLARGYHAISDTHVGDWGTQFGILLLGFKESGIALDDEALQADPFGVLEKTYIAENGRIKDDPERREHAKEEFAKLERGDADNRALWRWMVEISMKNLESSAARLGLLAFDEHRGESFYEDRMKPIVERATAAGIAQKADNGAIIVDLTRDGLDDAVLIKSDGASTYLLRDLATIEYRKAQWSFWKNIYVVDVRQDHHFRQLFRVAELLGFDDAGTNEHVSYGFVKLPEGMLSTRAGNTISLEHLLDEAEEKALAVIHEKNPDLTNAREVARIVGIGALKYFYLSYNRISDITFTWERALSFEGNSGPYLQYTHARLKSILRKAGAGESVGAPIGVMPKEDIERRVLVALMRFDEAVEDALEHRAPHLLAAYLYDLAGSVNEFYHAVPILSEDDPARRNFLLSLIGGVCSVLKQGLSFLGIDTVEEM